MYLICEGEVIVNTISVWESVLPPLVYSLTGPMTN